MQQASLHATWHSTVYQCSFCAVTVKARSFSSGNFSQSPLAIQALKACSKLVLMQFLCSNSQNKIFLLMKLQSPSMTGPAKTLKTKFKTRLSLKYNLMIQNLHNPLICRIQCIEGTLQECITVAARETSLSDTTTCLE